MKNVEQILASENRGARIMTIVAETPVRLKAGHPFHGDVVKAAKVNGIANFDYARAVEKRTGQAYQPRGEAWYVSLKKDGKPIPLVQNRQGDRKYLRIMVLHSDFRYFCQGRELRREEVEPWLPAKQPDANPTRMACYALEHIKTLILNGVHRNAN